MLPAILRLRTARLCLLGCALAQLAVGCGGGGSGTAPAPAPTPTPTPTPPPTATDSPFWSQWGFNAQHSGTVTVAAQSLNTQLADIIYDPFVAQEQAEAGGALIAHYPATLVDAGDFYAMTKTGTYVPCNPAGSWRNGAACGPNSWDRMIWNVARYNWQNGVAVKIWEYASDWKPLPNGQGLGGWEPVFHPLLANSVLYVPGAGGTVWRVNKTTGAALSQIDPFAGTTVAKRNAYVSGPLTSDSRGNIYYNVIEIADASAGDPWLSNDVVSAWLVRINVVGTAPAPTAAATIVSYATLIPFAPAASALACAGRFSTEPLPWPPSPTATPPLRRCGAQRPGVNVAPAIAPDGTIYTISRAHFNSLTSYMVAVNPDLTPKWQASMQRVLTDGCGVLVPIATNNITPNSCRPGSSAGVDPTTNQFGSADVTDLSSSSPTALPDGSVLYGAISNYNGFRGHLLKFSSAGVFLKSYDFGWDSTPAVYPHGGTYSIIIKDNHYEVPGLYCSSASTICGALPSGPYYITQLDASLNVEWKFQNTTIDASEPNGYEWCINAPAVDANGVVYVNGEDGYLYSINQGSGVMTVPRQKKFLKQAIGAAYTPLSIGADGKIYTQNAGHLFVVGN
jgi:hypothetical protein